MASSTFSIALAAFWRAAETVVSRDSTPIETCAMSAGISIVPCPVTQIPELVAPTDELEA